MLTDATTSLCVELGEWTQMKHTLVYNYIYNMYQKIKNDQSFESIKKKKKKKIYI